MPKEKDPSSRPSSSLGTGILFQERLSRLMLAANAKNDSELARALGIKPQSIRPVHQKKQIPSSWIEKISKNSGFSSDWIFFGRGPMRHDEDSAQESPSKAVSQDKSASSLDTPITTIQVLGLASCGISGWYNAGPLAIRIPVPIPYPNAKNLLAIIAIGTSMQPDGIRQGYLVFCDPNITPQNNDAIYIEQNDGRVSIKKYLGKSDKWLYLQGWMEPDNEGIQKPYTEKILLEIVKKIATVVLVQRKA